jgi:hypothetical protein
MIDRLLVICVFATAMYVAPVLAQFFLALCSWSIVIFNSVDITPFTITMYLWAVEFYYTTEYTSIFVAFYISGFTLYCNNPVSFSFVCDCMLAMMWRLSRHIRLLLNRSSMERTRHAGFLALMGHTTVHTFSKATTYRI